MEQQRFGAVADFFLSGVLLDALLRLPSSSVVALQLASASVR